MSSPSSALAKEKAKTEKVETDYIVLLQEEIINEIGTQTLARFGLNMISLNTYEAYGASVASTNLVSKTYDQHKNNPNFFGQTFEPIDVGYKNITSALLNKGEKTYTTDELADIKRVAEIVKDQKRVEALNEKDRKKFDFIMENFPEEVKTIFYHKEMLQNANKNDPSTDTVTFDKDGKVVQKSQHKVIKRTKDLLEDRYLENNDVFTVPFDDYARHKENLERMIENPKSEEERQKAQRALEILNKNNVTNRLMCENPRTTAVVTQAVAASGHIVQAGVSDAIVVSLSMLANGTIYEIRDSFDKSGSKAPILERIKRLLRKVLEAFKETFARGASFGAIDVVVDILAQLFKAVFGKLKLIWRELRNSAKSIYNAIWDFINGKVKNYQDLISVIIKALFSAAFVAFAISFETSLELQLAPLVGPIVATFLASALAIVVGALAVVTFSKSVDLALQALFGALAKRDLAKIRAEEVEKLCAEMLPQLIEDREDLERLIDSTFRERKLMLESSFSDMRNAMATKDIEKFLQELQNINSMYGESLLFKDFFEFDQHMLDKTTICKI